MGPEPRWAGAGYFLIFERRENEMKEGQPIVVTTAHRGVFFGYFKSMNGDSIVLTKARNCLYWPKEVHGFVGLATNGPISNSRIGPAVDEMKLLSVTAVLGASEAAVEVWESEPWK